MARRCLALHASNVTERRRPLCARSGPSITAHSANDRLRGHSVDQGTRTSDFPRAIYERLDRRTESPVPQEHDLFKSAGPWILAAPSRWLDARLSCNGHRENSATDCSNCFKLPHGLPAIARAPLGVRCWCERRDDCLSFKSLSQPGNRRRNDLTRIAAETQHQRRLRRCLNIQAAHRTYDDAVLSPCPFDRDIR